MKREIKPPIKSGELFMDQELRILSIGNLELPCTRIEFDLLKELILNRGIHKRKDLLIKVWRYQPSSPIPKTRTIDMHIARLRAKHKIIKNGLKTIPTFGYRWEGK